MNVDNIESKNKKIGLNSLFLYIRMFVIMFVSLYTSRVVISKLGIDNFGIYNTVNAVVLFFSFVNGALSTGTSRFITYSLGKDDKHNTFCAFSTAFALHCILALIIVIVSSTVWILCSKNLIEIPSNKFIIINYVFIFSLITAIFSITQTPYSACILSHERMSIYAYVSILEVILKLFICYLIDISDFDRLAVYSTLFCLSQLIVIFIYRFYCHKNFEESKFKLCFFSKIVFFKILKFSGWSLFANCAIAINNQGFILLFNLFFSPAVVAARAICLQVNNAASQLLYNLILAVTPRIVKLEASNNSDSSKKLLLESTVYEFFLMWLITFPTLFFIKDMINLWLVEVPPYTIVFIQLVLIQGLFQVFDSSFYTAFYANGRIKENALISPTISLLQFPLLYVLFYIGFSPVILSWVNMMVYLLLGLVIKPILLIHVLKYTVKDISAVFIPCLKVVLLSIPFPILIKQNVCDSLVSNFLLSLFTFFITSCVILFFGFSSDLRRILIKKILYILN